jgi:hypothetical protein
VPVTERDPVADARDLVASRFPGARWAVLAGSVITAARTPGSDLDVVVLMPPGVPGVPHRDTLHFRGWPVELFVHDADSLTRFLALEYDQRKPTLRRMVATGVPLAGDPGADSGRAARELAAGPPPLTTPQADRWRYTLTDLLDDLTHVIDAGERIALTGTGWVTAAEAALVLRGAWSGRGKWLLRELRALDPGLASAWLSASGSADAVAAFVRRVLDDAGGPLYDGYRADDSVVPPR